MPRRRPSSSRHNASIVAYGPLPAVHDALKGSRTRSLTLPQLAQDFDPDAVGTFDYEKSEYQISHPLWRDDEHIVVWSPHAGRIRYHLYHDSVGGAVEVIFMLEDEDAVKTRAHCAHAALRK